MITRRNKATTSHYKSFTTNCSTTACRPFVSSARSCSKTRANGTRCCNSFLLLLGILLVIGPSPRNLLAITQEFSTKLLRGFACQPHNRVRPFRNGSRCVRSAHVRPHPTRTNRIHCKFRKCRRQLRRHAIQSSFRNAITWRPALRASRQLTTAAGNVDHPRRLAFG